MILPRLSCVELAFYHQTDAAISRAHLIVAVLGIGVCGMTALQPPVRLAFCITDLDPGGAERALVQLVTRLDRTQWRPSVFCLSGPGLLTEDLIRADVPVVCFGAQRARQIGIVGRLAGHLRRWRPALLQTFLFHANIAGRVAGRMAGVQPIVSGIRVAEKRSRIPLLIDRWTNWLVVQNVCVSQAVADFSVQQGGLAPSKVTVIPNAVDAERFERAQPMDLSVFGIPPNSRTVLFVGRLDPQKAPDDLLAAFAGLVPQHEDLHLLYVGDGPLKHELWECVRHQELGTRVHFAGWQPDIAGIMRSATCLVLPSRWEGMPNVVLEAMAAGLPTITTRVEGVTEIVRDGVSGLLIAPGAVGELQSALDRLMRTPQLAAELIRNAQTIVKSEFTILSIVARYDRLYRSLLPI